MANKPTPYNITIYKFAQAQQPKFEERKGTEKYVEFGENNDYPGYLLELYNESPKHGAIVKSKANYIYGKGFEGIPKPANIQGESWNKVVKKCILDDELYGGYYLQLIYNLQGKIADVYHLAFQKVRTNKEETKFYVKNDWNSLKKENPRIYKAYDGKYDPENPSRVIFVKQYNPKSDVYPLPNYFQGLNYIESDIQVSRHILGNAKDGFSVTKMIQFYNGEPTEEQKGEVTRKIKEKGSGSEGDRYWVVFNKSKDNAVDVSDLGTTMLTKEDFTNVNQLIQQEIFACHQVTSPMLFGIKTEGQLGGRSEIKDAYEIFNNTYVNERQQAHEETFNTLLNMTGVQGQFKIVPVEPLGFSLEDALLLKVLPVEWFHDKMGVDDKYKQLPPVEGTATPAQPGVPGQPPMVNSMLTNLTGRQRQGIMSIVRKFIKGEMNLAQASLMLKSGFAFTDDDVSAFLGVENEKFASQEEIDFALIEQFSQVGESKDDYEILSSKPAREAEYFADVKELSELESNVLNLIKKDKRITSEVIATTLKQDVKLITKVMTGLETAGIITATSTTMGQDTIIEREATNIKVKDYKPTTTDILLRYSYDGPKDSKNRPFCAKLMELNKLYSRSDIEQISERLGYSVWDRRGGWFTQPDGEHRPYCRHQWFALTVIRKS